MKNHYITQHSPFCPCHENNRDKIDLEDNDFKRSIRLFCDLNPNILLFFHNNEFNIIKYNQCILINWENEAGFLVDILKQSLKGKNKSFYDVSKSNVYDKILKSINEDKYLMKGIFTEINYIYSGFKKYCIQSELKIEDFDFDNQKLVSDYEIVKEYIEKNFGYNSDFLNQAESLFHANLKPNVTNKFLYKTVNELITKINKTTKYGNH